MTRRGLINRGLAHRHALGGFVGAGGAIALGPATLRGRAANGWILRAHWEMVARMETGHRLRPRGRIPLDPEWRMRVSGEVSGGHAARVMRGT
jgi:hypothetical protein